MSRDARLFLIDIAQACDHILGWTHDRTGFDGDTMLYSAVVRELTVIGEAVKHLPEDIRAMEPSVPWSSVAGLRDIIVHGYFALRDDALWIVATDRVPELRTAIGSMLDALSEDSPEAQPGP